MACLAINILMPSLQLIIGLRMIKGFNGCNLMKRQLIVALTAVTAELALVRVLMAICALFIGHTRELLKSYSCRLSYFMAFHTFNCSMFSNQLKFGLFMVKSGSRFESIGIMAG